MRTNGCGFLLDSSVLIALSFDDHVHFARAQRWFLGIHGHVVTCPITQGSFVRMCMRLRDRNGFALALEMLGKISLGEKHLFIPDDIDYRQIRPDGIIGHRQVTDAYLAHLAMHHGLRLATLDEAQAALYPEVAELV
ncbi:MAG: PIN domain-containing protein [Chlorobia bacterium]|nr:PIN domain-containing protein [Fimbriimonadaceae bacterium]